MGASLARLLVRDGCRVALVARRTDELALLADSLNAPKGPNGEPNAIWAAHDVKNADDVPALFQQLCRDLGGLDVIFYATGIQPRITPTEYDWEKDEATVQINFLGAVAWLNQAARRFDAMQSGTIVGISSVAGDRGRVGYPVYGATKAALNAYLESLRNRLGTKGVRVVTVKPGPVDTPLTHGMDKLPLLISSDEAARQILQAAESGAHTAYVPGVWRLIMAIVRAIPSAVFQKLKF